MTHTITVVEERYRHFRWHCTCGRHGTKTFYFPGHAQSAGSTHAAHSRALETASNHTNTSTKD